MGEDAGACQSDQAELDGYVSYRGSAPVCEGRRFYRFDPQVSVLSSSPSCVELLSLSALGARDSGLNALAMTARTDGKVRLRCGLPRD